MVLLTFVWKCFQGRNFHGVVVRLYKQSIESWVGLVTNKLKIITSDLQRYMKFTLKHSIL